MFRALGATGIYSVVLARHAAHNELSWPPHARRTIAT
jgi:hypothetical protein